MLNAAFFSVLLCFYFSSVCDGVVRPALMACSTEANWKTVFNRPLKEYKGLSTEECNSRCFQEGFRLAAVNEDECLCAVSVKRATNKRNCSPGSIKIYSTGIANVKGKRLGCVSDLGVSRVLRKYKADLVETNTPQVCVGICSSLGYTHAGLQNSHECWCGEVGNNTQESYDCNMPCPGGPADCGGLWALDIYETGVEHGSAVTTSIDYVGCFDEAVLDDTERDPVEVFEPLSCIVDCISKGLYFAVIFKTTECHCRPIPKSDPSSVDASLCSSSCPAYEAYSCGSSTHVSVYSTGLIGEPMTGKSIGCFRDTSDDLLSAKVASSEENTPESCALTCLSEMFPFSGLKNGTICKCGKSRPERLRETREAECNVGCPGNSALSCGGKDSLYIYRTGLDFLEDECYPNSDTYVNGNKVCQRQLIFQEDFNSLDNNVWRKTIRISGEDHEFTIYTDEDENLKIKDGKLIIRPTVQNDSFVRGKINLKGCTSDVPSDCTQESKAFLILPPVKSGQICTDKSFSFKYGKVTIGAKLPTGDWVYPQIWLKPSKQVYGPGYESGKILIAFNRGNEVLRLNKMDFTCRNHVESGILGGESGKTTRTHEVRLRGDQPWTDGFHNYTLVWTPDKLSFYYDGNWLSDKVIYNKETSSVAEVLGFSKENSPWKEKGPTAPFDQEFYLCLGVGVGGSQYFPDTSVRKPWRNKEVKATLNFWLNKEYWQNTWSDTTQLEVSHVSVEAL